jgi:hypothetical protein
MGVLMFGAAEQFEVEAERHEEERGKCCRCCSQRRVEPCQGPRSTDGMDGRACISVTPRTMSLLRELAWARATRSWPHAGHSPEPEMTMTTPTRPSELSAAPTGIDLHAPVVARHETTIAAPLDVVWRLHTDIDAWPAWQHDITVAHLDGLFAPGSSFAWQTHGLDVQSRIYRVDAAGEDERRTPSVRRMEGSRGGTPRSGSPRGLRRRLEGRGRGATLRSSRRSSRAERLARTMPH